MSKSNVKKSTVDPTKCNNDSRRPSVFERLGTKPVANANSQSTSDYCRNWALNGNCSYGKNCKYAITHTLISPSKRVKKDNVSANAPLLNEDPFKRLASKLLKNTSHSPDLNLEEWNQTDLEYEDEKVLERRRQLLQRELEIQMKKDKQVHGKDKVKYKKKVMSTSSSSHSSSSSSSSSSSLSSQDSSSSSTSDSRKKVKKFKKVKHRSASPHYEEDMDRKKKLKLKRLGTTKADKPLVKKKRKIDVAKKETSVKTAKKPSLSPVKKHVSTTRAKSPAPSASHVSTRKSKERNRSESPKSRAKEPPQEENKHHKKSRKVETTSRDAPKSKSVEKMKDLDKGKIRPIEEKSSTKAQDCSKQRSKDRERRSRTPPLERSKHPHSKDTAPFAKSKRSQTPEKACRSKHDPIAQRHQDKQSTSSRRSREPEKKDREMHKSDRSRDREDARKSQPNKAKVSSSQDDHRKTSSRDFESKSYTADRGRQRERSKERRDKDHGGREQRSHSRLSKDQRDSQRDKEREELPERRRERSRDRDKDKDSAKISSSSSAVGSGDKSRYGRDKDRLKECDTEKSGSRERRGDRGDKDRGGDSKNLDRDRSSQRFENRYDRPVDKDISLHKPVERSDRADRFPRERSLDRGIVNKNVSSSRDHLVDRDPLYDRDRHKRFNPRFDRGHSEYERKDLSSLKIDRLADRRESPQRGMEIDRNFERGYPRLPPEHWDKQQVPPTHADYRDHHSHEEDCRKPGESRRYSPFNDRRGRDEREKPRYGADERPFEDLHHPMYAGDKLRSGGIRDEANAENWDVHHDVEHGPRDRAYTAEWEEREWRTRALWDRESIPRSEVHEEEWAARYDSPMSDWKMNESRKWDNQPLHLRGSYRNERAKDLDADSSHGYAKTKSKRKRKRRSYNTPEVREESAHCSKQSNLHASMKDEPINKKLMELAEGRPRKSREKSADSHQKKAPSKEKIEPMETVALEPKRPPLEEPLPTLHTESDLSDISDDPDDILNMDDEMGESSKSAGRNCLENTEREIITSQNQESCQSPPKVPSDDAFFARDKETLETISYGAKTIEDENMETMDFEEISDGELEEDVKTSCKGLGDALGVDWESLVKETLPRRLASSNKAQDRWQCKAVFRRIGISVNSVGPKLLKSFVEKYEDDGEEKFLMDDLALLHTAVVRENCLSKNPSYGFNDDPLYVMKNEADSDADDAGDLKPCTSMFEEVKLLLQQAAA